MIPSDRLEQAAVSVDQVAHDLSNHCTSLLGFAELALDGLSAESTEHTYLLEIAESGRQTIALAERLRQIAASLRTLAAP